MSYQYDLFVIGGGSGGVRAARIAASLGAKVGLCEMQALGGTCVNVGCIPKKLFAYAGQYASLFEEAAGYGWQLQSPIFNWSTLVENKDKEISRLNSIYENLLTQANVSLIRGRGTLVDAHTVEVNGTHITAKYILLATGGKPRPLPTIGSELASYSDDMFTLSALPKKIVIVGGGYIAVEFASIFNELGVEVTLVHRSSQLLRGFEPELASFLCESFEQQGLHLQLSTQIVNIDKAIKGLSVQLDNGTTCETDLVLSAIGRDANLAHMGLETVGVTTAPNGNVEVNAQLQTSIDSIYALGDIIGRIQLTPVALAEGQALAHALFGNKPFALNYQNIPSAAFSTPQIASVGLTEEEALKTFPQLQCYRSNFTPLKHTLSKRPVKTWLKLLVDPKTDRVLGCHMAGEDAAEIVQGLAIAIQCGATKTQFDQTIGIHPTTAEEWVTLRTPS